MILSNIAGQEPTKQPLETTSKNANLTQSYPPTARPTIPFPMLLSDQVQQTRRMVNTVASREQPTVEELARYGIKVRDFCYESTLPPIRPLIYQQVLPGVESLNGDSQDEHRAKRTKLLGRVPTEPVVDRALCTATTSREPGPAGHHQLMSPSNKRPMPINETLCTPLITFSVATRSSIEQCPPAPQFESQGSGVDTPLVTPTNSFQYNTPGIRIRHDDQLDTASSQLTDDAPVSYSQLGFTTPEEPSQSDNLFTHGSPLPSPNLRRSNSPTARRSAVSGFSRRMSSLLGLASSSQRLSATPYFLRQRKPISYPTDTTTGRTKRRGVSRLKVKPGKT